jgi:formylglycine-generating enzyme required for sulfatase activity
MMDMAGNVSEFVSDWWQSDYYSISPYSNPTGPATGVYKVVRGSAWKLNARTLPIANRGWYFINVEPFNFGIRCAAFP